VRRQAGCSIRALRKRLKEDDLLSRETMERIARRLDSSLPPAGA
jgi:hypothetical protein